MSAKIKIPAGWRKLPRFARLQWGDRYLVQRNGRDRWYYIRPRMNGWKVSWWDFVFCRRR